MAFTALLAVASLVAGGVAAVVGFGIGSLLTPTLAIATGTKLAVAAVAIPHFAGSLQRFWLLRSHVDRRVLVGFGIASAAGGLLGAVMHTRVSSRGLAIVFGALLVLAGVSELSGWIQRVRWSRGAAWIAGFLSGGFGGLVGNQGGIRSAAMLGFDVPRESFVATATAIALFVDVARLPVYLSTQWTQLLAVWPSIVVTTIGVVIGTALGTRILGRVPERAFRRIIAVFLLGLGLYMVVAGGAAG